MAVHTCVEAGAWDLQPEEFKVAISQHSQKLNWGCCWGEMATTTRARGGTGSQALPLGALR